MMDRKIYATPCGYKFDPLTTWRALVVGSQGKINEWIKSRNGDDLLAAADAEERLVALVRGVFDLPVWSDQDPNGFTDQQALDTLAHFNGWLSGKGDRG